MPKVSVIIPTYNRERFVGKAIESVLDQSFDDFEIIVIDDGSTDKTHQTLQRYGNRIRYIYQENAGASAARNTGIKAAKGEWLAFLDSDDEWKLNYLTKQIQSARNIPGLCMQTTDCQFVGLDGKTENYFEINGSLAEFRGASYLLPKKPFSFIVKHGPWQVGATIIRSDAIAKAGLFDTSLPVSHDLDLMARVALQGAFGMMRETLVTVYRRDEDIECLTQQAKSNILLHRENDEKMYEKLARIKTIKYWERKSLNMVMSANRRAIGNLFFEVGKMKEATDSYKRAVFIDPSVRSVGKYILTKLSSISTKHRGSGIA